MRPLAWIMLAALLPATPVFAGVTMTAGACPENPGATSSTAMDCAGGGTLNLYAVYQPDEVIPDLVAFDFQMKITPVTGSVADLPFWDMEDGTPCFGLSLSAQRPASGCPNWQSLWGSQSGSGVSAIRNTVNSLTIAGDVYQPSLTPVAPGQRWFLFQLAVDGSHATEAGGTCAGCTAPVSIDWWFGWPRSNGSMIPTSYPPCANVSPDLCQETTPLARVVVNDLPVPVQRRTWGSLKALYR